MRTNYYLHMNVCEHCGRSDEQKHIGKGSAGWCFALHVYPDEGIRDLADWERLFPTGVIKDECGTVVSVADMLKIITERQWKRPAIEPYGYRSWSAFHDSNHSEPGPDGLIRSKVDGTHCIGHGFGTWDLIVGEFS